MFESMSGMFFLFFSEPWVIDINKLHLIIGPCANDTSNVDEELEQSAKKEK